MRAGPSTPSPSSPGTPLPHPTQLKSLVNSKMERRRAGAFVEVQERLKVVEGRVEAWLWNGGFGQGLQSARGSSRRGAGRAREGWGSASEGGGLGGGCRGA